MGACISSEPEVDFTGPVDFDHFHILRAIGKGAFGKVCIVKKKDTKQMYAMKYMNKIQIIKKHAVENVFREIHILQTLEHPFLVNLWFTFQDREDIFMVLDLMLGGDLSYHLEKEGRFQVARVRLYIAELALGLEYLRGRCILHRDVKPANMLLDSQGHVHLTDFNVACIIKPNSHITSVTGTKPYMAPEVVHPTGTSYSYAVDWWSLGVSAYEMLRGQRPFVVERHTSNEELYSQLRHTRPSASARWDQYTCDVLKLLLHPEEDKRLQSVEKMKELRFFESINWIEVEEKETTPPFVPPQNRINCDPTYELEEMIVEPNPLHKKHHRLSKRNFKSGDDEMERELDKIERRFKVYSREKEKDDPAETEAGSGTGCGGGSEKANVSEDERDKTSPDKSHDKSTRSNNLSEIKEEDEQKDEGVEVVIEPVAPGAVSEETTPQVDGKATAASQNHNSEIVAAVSNKEDAPATNSTNEERTDSDIKNGSPAVEGDSIQRTDTSPPPEEGEGGISVQRSRTDSGPPPDEGDTVTSFSSVKHLLS